MNPVISHTTMSQPALPTLRVISALTIKIPEQIMLPATPMVASKRPSVGLKWLVVLIKNPAFDSGMKIINMSEVLFLLLVQGIQSVHHILRDIVGTVFQVHQVR